MTTVKLCECGCGQPTTISKRTFTAKGHLPGQPMRFIQGHHNRLRRPSYAVEDRGYKTPCWIWQGWHGDMEYGRAQWEGVPRKAHRVVWEQKNGPIPDGLELDHLCRVRACVNPEHLEPVTRSENLRRAYVFRPREPHPLRLRREAAGLRQRDLAEMLGYSQALVSRWECGLAEPTPPTWEALNRIIPELDEERHV